MIKSSKFSKLTFPLIQFSSCQFWNSLKKFRQLHCYKISSHTNFHNIIDDSFWWWSNILFITESMLEQFRQYVTYCPNSSERNMAGKAAYYHAILFYFYLKFCTRQPLYLVLHWLPTSSRCTHGLPETVLGSRAELLFLVTKNLIF